MYRYYRRRMAPKVDVRLVIAITLTIISAVQVGIHQDQDKNLIFINVQLKYCFFFILIVKKFNGSQRILYFYSIK